MHHGRNDSILYFILSVIMGRTWKWDITIQTSLLCQEPLLMCSSDGKNTL